MAFLTLRPSSPADLSCVLLSRQPQRSSSSDEKELTSFKKNITIWRIPLFRRHTSPISLLLKDTLPIYIKYTTHLHRNFGQNCAAYAIWSKGFMELFAYLFMVKTSTSFASHLMCECVCIYV